LENKALHVESVTLTIEMKEMKAGRMKIALMAPTQKKRIYEFLFVWESGYEDVP